MMPIPYLPSATAIENHLWQSTIFAVTVSLLTLLLRNNRAGIRYTLWLAASIKFLIPFSLLIALGSFLPHPHHVIAAPQPILYSTVDAVTQPFSEADLPRIPPHTPGLKERLTTSLPLILIALWLSGAITVLLIWYARWRQISVTLRGAVLAEDSREAKLLHHLQIFTGQPTNIALRHSPQLTEPGIIGIFHPILLWPAQLSDHLEDAHIEAILAHELTHARRHDNLAAALHMLVEAVFWFHPIVWWIERRMIEERERACDESVVHLTGKPGLYAESLLKTCRFCVESPLACVSGITGADLNQRVRSIMTLRLQKLSSIGKFMLIAFGLVTVMGPVAFGLMHWIPQYGQILHATGSLPSFEVVSIRPWQRPTPPPPPPSANGAPAPPKIMKVDPSSGAERRQTSDQVHMILPVQVLIESAYNLPFDTRRIIGGPDWLRNTDTDQYEIRAKIDSSQFAAMQKMTSAQQREQIALMEQSLLAERFNLKLHFETREMPGFALVIAKGTPKLTPAKDGESSHLAEFDNSQASGLTATAVTLDQLVLSPLFLHGRPGVNQTSLKGAYDFTLKLKDKNDPAEPDSETSIFTAVQEQLGLKLVPTKTPVEVLVIDHIERPSDNSTEPEPASTQNPEPRTAAATVASFDVASVRQNNSGQPPAGDTPRSNVPLGTGNVYGASEGLLRATNFPLLQYLEFAYKLTDYQEDLLRETAPDWVIREKFNIEARTENRNVTKDQMRLMMQSLLAERFRLTVHYEPRQVSVFALTPLRPGTTGPKLQPHPAGASCTGYPLPAPTPDATPAQNQPETIAGGYPTVCGGILGIPASARDRYSLGGRNVSMNLIASSLSSWGHLGRPVVNRTDLAGAYDFALEFTPDPPPAYAQGIDSGGPTFQEALKRQLGLKLEPQKAPVDFLIIDHVERPSSN